MPLKKIALLAALLALLTGIALYLNGPGNRYGTQEKAAVFTGFDVAEAASLTISGPGGELSLHRREEEVWLVAKEGAEYPADGTLAGNTLDDLGRLKVLSIASTNAGKHPLFGIDEKEGTRVTVEGKDGGTLLSFTVGKEGSDFFTGYLRRDGEEEVLLVSANLKGVFGRTLSAWRDRDIIKVDAVEISSLTVRRGEETFTLTRDGEGWNLDDAPAGIEAVESYVETIAALRASGFAAAEEIAGAGLEEPEAVIAVTNGETSLDLTVGAYKESSRERYLRIGDDDTIYLVSSYAAAELLKGRDDFPPPGESGEKADGEGHPEKVEKE